MIKTKVYIFSGIIPLLTVLLMSCGQRTTQLTQKHVSVEQPLAVFTYGDRGSYTAEGNQSTSYLAGSSRSHSVKMQKLREGYANELMNVLKTEKRFSSVKYVGDGREALGYPLMMKVSFLYVLQGKQGWPIEVKVHFLLEEVKSFQTEKSNHQQKKSVKNKTIAEKKVLFNQVYHSQLKNNKHCKNCTPEMAITKALNEKLMPDLLQVMSRKQ